MGKSTEQSIEYQILSQSFVIKKILRRLSIDPEDPQWASLNGISAPFTVLDVPLSSYVLRRFTKSLQLTITNPKPNGDETLID